MEQKVLVDTNLIIYYLSSEYSQEFKLRMDKVIQDLPYISFVTKIELLGWKGHTSESLEIARSFLTCFITLFPDEQLLETASSLARKRKMSLGDTIIAATTIENNLILATRNTKDFDWIENLQLYNPI